MDSRTKFSISILLPWVVITAIAWSIGWVLGRETLINLFDANPVQFFLLLQAEAEAAGQNSSLSNLLIPLRMGAPGGYIGGIAGGLLAGVTQWLILRKHFEDAFFLVILTPVAWIIAFSATFAAFFPFPFQNRLQEIIVGGVGASLGAMVQWVVIREWVYSSALWIPAAGIAWALAISLFQGVATIHGDEMPLEIMRGIALITEYAIPAALVFAIATGIMALNLIRSEYYYD